ncbi:hypothetical protein RB195_001718 [Necator americanus]|uniref:Secreted protein n=1 Tax=Necator americanus TaxID=51031 RepID=A0ABR1DFM2_NECAM
MIVVLLFVVMADFGYGKLFTLFVALRCIVRAHCVKLTLQDGVMSSSLSRSVQVRGRVYFSRDITPSSSFRSWYIRADVLYKTI